LARLDESIAAFNQRFIFPFPFAIKIIKINLWNQGKKYFSANVHVPHVTFPSIATHMMVLKNNENINYFSCTDKSLILFYTCTL
jgi:hypothetical protein